MIRTIVPFLAGPHFAAQFSFPICINKITKMKNGI